MNSIAFTSSSKLSFSIRIPFSSLTKSSGPPHLDAITGRPEAIASMYDTPKVSLCEASTKQSESESCLQISSLSTFPIILTCLPKPSSSICASILARICPSPTIIKLAGLPALTSSLKAETTKSILFWGTKLDTLTNLNGFCDSFTDDAFTLNTSVSTILFMHKGLIPKISSILLHRDLLTAITRSAFLYISPYL